MAFINKNINDEWNWIDESYNVADVESSTIVKLFGFLKIFSRNYKRLNYIPDNDNKDNKIGFKKN